MSNFVNLLDVIYPVGSIYQSMSSTSPASTIGGTWTQLKTFLYGSTTANQTGGEATHTLTINEMPNHTHDMNYSLSGTNLSLPSNVGNWFVFDSNFGWICPRNPVRLNGGGQHTTTCRPTRLASSGTGQHNCVKSKRFKFKRGGVCLTTLTSWILSTRLGQYFSQTRQSRQRIQSAGHGQSSTMTRSSVAAPLTPRVAQTLLGLQLTKCRHIIISSLEMVHGLAVTRVTISTLLSMVEEIGIHQWIRWKPLVATKHLITDLNTGHLTSIFVQPSYYMLGGVA